MKGENKPFLNANLVGPRAELGGRELLHIAYCIVRIALHADFFAQTIVENHFNHGKIWSLYRNPYIKMSFLLLFSQNA